MAMGRTGHELDDKGGEHQRVDLRELVDLKKHQSTEKTLVQEEETLLVV